MRLKEYFESFGTRTSFIAKSAGISMQQLHNLLHGTVEPRASTMEGLRNTFDGLGYDVRYLNGWVELIPLDNTKHKKENKRKKQQQENDTTSNTPIGLENAG